MANKFTNRSEEIEIMDDLEGGGPIMDQTLRELEVINKWLGGNDVTVNGLNKLLESTSKKTLKIVDLGCGGGDMLKLLIKWARKREISVELIGIDANPHVIDFAKKNTSQYPEISYKSINILSDEFKEIEADIFTATLFAHHFTCNQIVGLVNQLRKQSRVGIVINDLHRHWFAYHSIKLLTSLFSKSTMVQNDAAVSVLRSFQKSDLQKIFDRCQTPSTSIRWMWAFRWQIIIPCG